MQITKSNIYSDNPIFNSMAKSRLYFKLLGDSALPFLPAFESPTISCIHKIAIASLISQFNSPKNTGAIIKQHLEKEGANLNDATVFILKNQPEKLLLHKLLTDPVYFKTIAVAADKYCYSNRNDPDLTLFPFIYHLIKGHDHFHQEWNNPRREIVLPYLKRAVDLLEEITLCERLESEQKLFELFGIQANKFLASGVRIDPSIYECMKFLAIIYNEFTCNVDPAPMLQKLLSIHGTVLKETLMLLDATCQGRIFNIYNISAIPLFTSAAQAKILSKTRELKLSSHNVGDETQFTDVNFILTKLENYMNYRMLNDDEIKECELFVALFNDPLLKGELLKKDRAPLFEILKNLKQVLNLKPNLTFKLDQCKEELNAENFATMKFSAGTEQLILLILSSLNGYGKIPSDKMEPFFLDKGGILRTLELFKDNDHLFDAEICTYIAIVFSNVKFRNLISKEDEPYCTEVLQTLKYILNNLPADKFPEDGFLIQCRADLNK